MKYLKVLCFLVALCCILLVSCKRVEDEVITGDVKENSDVLSVDEGQSTADDTEVSPSVDVEKVPDEAEDREKLEVNIENLIQELGCVISEGGEYKTDAERLCDAIIDADTGTFAEFTMGKREYYDFLEKVEISSYTLYPVEFTQEKIAEMNENYMYPVASDNYFVEFEVEKSDCAEFSEGKCIYYFGLEMDAVAGNLLSAFVPYEKAKESIFIAYDTDYTSYFIDEFSSLYFRKGKIYNGRNYPDSFDFSDSSHLITHLMARSGVYGEPPYTFEQVNEFITESFDGNEGLSLSQINTPYWTSAGVVYPSDDSGRIYGCSWGHGGTSAEEKIINVERDGNTSIYTVQFFADYSGVAKAKCADFHFEKSDSGLVKLTLLNIYDDTGREIALTSV